MISDYVRLNSALFQVILCFWLSCNAVAPELCAFAVLEKRVGID